MLDQSPVSIAVESPTLPRAMAASCACLRSPAWALEPPDPAPMSTRNLSAVCPYGIGK